MNLTRSIARAARPTLGLFVLCAAAAGLGRPTAALAQNYPRLGLYGSITGDGYPFIVVGVNGTLQDTTLDAVARYDEVALDASPISEYRPDVLTELRARHPGIRLLAYVTGHAIWDPSGADSLTHYPTLYYRKVRDLDGWLYDTYGYKLSGANVNLAKRDLFGHFIVAEALADLFYDVVLHNQAAWDGIFIDVYCKSILWMQTPTVQIDYARAGYPSLEAFDAAWGAAIDTLGDRLRRRAGSSIVMVGNCGQSTNYGTFNGWMRENFPFQNGGDWYSNMFRKVGGYFPDDVHFRAPPSNYLFSAMSGLNPYSSSNVRKVRFGLASAALGGGFGVFGPQEKTARPLPYHMYWYDEYSVDLATGRSSPDLQHAGWLGQPLGPYSQMIWPGSGPDAVTNPDFETDVTTGWNFTVTPLGTLSQDAGTAAVGSASAHVNVLGVSSVAWAVAFNTNGELAVQAYQPYSATFWAKASVARNITVSAGALAATQVPITTEWQHYQVTLVPFSAGSVELQFFLAEATGDVWLDDVHFQPGISNLYRRDFQNGIVLVNPANQTMTVNLERDFRKILGTRDPVTNDGSTVTQVTLYPNDALFLIGDDRIPPSAVMDLQPGPAWTPRTTRAKGPATQPGAQKRP